MHYLKQFKKHIAENDYTAFLVLWEEYCQSDQVDADEFLRILETAQNSSFAESFGKHVEKGIELWHKVEAGDLSHKIIKLIIDLQTTNTQELAKFVLDYLAKQHPKEVLDPQKIRLVGLRDAHHFQGAISHFELLLHLKAGNCVFHTGGWSVGQILEASFLREQVVLEFAGIPGKKDLSFQNAFNTLIPLADDHFLARRFSDPDAFEAFAWEHPVDLLKLLLRDLGPKTAHDIKEEICDFVIPTEDWQKWWQGARAKARKDSALIVPDDLKTPFTLVNHEGSHEDRFQHSLETTVTPSALIHLIYTFLRDFPSALKNNALHIRLQTKLTEALSIEMSDAEALQVHFLLEDLVEGKKHAGAKELLERLPCIEDAVRQIDIPALQKRALQGIKTCKADWPEIFVSCLLSIDQNALRDFILQELLNADHKVKVHTFLEHLMQHPAQAPHALLWYFKKITHKGGSELPFADEEGKARFLEALLVALATLDRDMALNRDLVKKIQQFLMNGRYALIRKIFAHANSELVQEFLLLASKCTSLSEHDIKLFHSLAVVAHPSLKKFVRHRVEESTPETVWTTEVGYNLLKDKIHKLATVDTVETAKEIEVARQLGDLRENAEYKAAMEKRAHIQAELKLLSEQLQKMQILTPADVHTNVVGIGTVIECEADDGTRTTYTLLGPLEADIQKHILSFQSKLAQEICGRKVNEKIKIQGTEYTIKNIRSFFENSV